MRGPHHVDMVRERTKNRMRNSYLHRELRALNGASHDECDDRVSNNSGELYPTTLKYISMVIRKVVEFSFVFYFSS